jgi:hypothetical protein
MVRHTPYNKPLASYLMGLDIYLIKVVGHRVDDANFLPADENPELETQFGHLKSSHTADYGQGLETVIGYRYEELRYQRKGVTRDFYNRYQPDEFIFSKKGLDELATFVENEFRKTFENDFVDKFIEGDTIVMLSY